MSDWNVDSPLCLVLHKQLAPRRFAGNGLQQLRDGEATVVAC